MRQVNLIMQNNRFLGNKNDKNIANTNWAKSNFATLLQGAKITLHELLMV